MFIIKYITFFLLITCLLLIACKKPICKKSRKDEISGIIVSEFDFGECYDGDAPLDEYIITDDSSYQLLNPVIFYNRNDCKNATLPPIDFSMHSLLGKFVDGSCPVFKSQVIDDDINKQYLFSIEVIECWPCKKLYEKMIWVLVPILSQGYTVKFEVK